MKKIILSGAGGKMGKAVREAATNRLDCSIVAGVDKTKGFGELAVFSSPYEINTAADVLIDFSHPSLLDIILDYCLQKKMPAVVCTTGLSAGQVWRIKEASEKIPVFYSPNMSVGVNLMAKLCKKAAKVLGAGFNIEIIEKHHNQKIDAPSGTALMLADSISEALDYKPEYIYDRHTSRRPREHTEIGIHCVRGGSIAGEHDVIFAGSSEIITISHSAQSKEAFATGAINAAMFLCTKPAGMYEMEDLLEV